MWLEFFYLEVKITNKKVLQFSICYKANFVETSKLAYKTGHVNRPYDDSKITFNSEMTFQTNNCLISGINFELTNFGQMF
jgi:hypothetical protein